MINNIINLLLFLIVILLLIPLPVFKTIRKISPYLLIVVFVVICSGILQNTTERNIIITASNEKNDQAQGTEIWLKSVVVDGEEKSAKEIFSDGWIYEEGYLKWRSYDQGQDMTSSVSARFGIDQSVELIFDANIWRGKVEIRDGFKIIQVDCYKNSENGSLTVNLMKMPWSIRLSGNMLFSAITAILCLLAAVFIFIDRFRQKPNPELNHVAFSDREGWIDFLKVISAFMVVLIHAVGSAYGSLPIGSTQWKAVLFLNALPRFAVPVFIMISGVLLLNKEISTKKTIKNVKHGVFLLIIWNVIYIFLQAVLWGPSEDILYQILSLPVRQGPSGHLWYAYFIVWLYIFSPVLSAMYRALTIRQRLYFSFVALFLPSVFDLYSKIVLNEGVISSASTIMTVNYMGMLFLGRVLYDLKEQLKHMEKISIIAIILGLGGMIFCTYHFSALQGIPINDFFMETYFFAIIYAVGVFVLGMKFSLLEIKMPVIVKKIVTQLSIYSIGIYFSHCVVVWTLGDLQFGDIIIRQNETAIAVLCCCMAYYLMSIIWVYLMSKIPGIKKIIS